MKAGAWQEPASFGTTALILLLLIVPPFLALGIGLLGVDPEHGLGLLPSLSLWRLFGRTIALAAAVTASATLIGVPLGFLLARTDAVGRSAAAFLHGLPLAVSPFLLALGWFHTVGRGGVLGSQLGASLLFSEIGAVAVLALAFAPVVTALTALALLGVDPGLEEAGLVLASPARVALGILLPLAAPSIALGALIVFALSFSELGVPMFLRVSTYPAAVFARLGGMDYSPAEAFALVLPLLALTLALVAIERRLLGGRPLAVHGLRRDHLALRLGASRGAASIGLWVFVLASLLPIGGLALATLRGEAARSLPQWIGGSIETSLFTAVSAATLIAAAGIVVGRALARGQRAARILDGLGVLAFVAPGAVLGVGWIAVWNRPMLAAIYGSGAVLVLANVARYAVLGVRALSLAMRQSSPHLEEAAAVLGASFFARLARIVVPTHRRAILITWFLAFVFCFRDLDLGILFYPPGGETLPIRIFTLEANGPEPVVSALALLQVVLTGSIAAAGLWLIRWTAR